MTLFGKFKSLFFKNKSANKSQRQTPQVRGRAVVIASRPPESGVMVPSRTIGYVPRGPSTGWNPETDFRD